MVMRMDGLVKRGGVWVFRRRVPDRLRLVIGTREVRRSLKTGDERVALSRWASVKADVDRIFAEAERGVKSPSRLATRPWPRGGRT